MIIYAESLPCLLCCCPKETSFSIGIINRNDEFIVSAAEINMH